MLFLYSCKSEDVPNPLNNSSKELNNKEKKAVIGGQTVNITSRPYQTAIYIGGSFEGGAVILNNEWILTAAHVVTESSSGQTPILSSINSIKVGTGSSNNPNLNLHSISELHVHDQFQYINDYLPYDLALLKLSTPLVYSSTQSPINYSIPNDPLNVNDMTSVSGWGGIACSPNSSTNLLKAADIPVTTGATPYFIEASSTTSGSYHGDSGGPLVKYIPSVGNILVGAVHGGNCTAGIQIYTRISYFTDWIKNITNGLERPKIDGEPSFCNSSSYNISNLPPGATVNWSVNIPANASLSISGNTATLTTVYGGNIILSANISFPWGSNINISKSIIARKSLLQSNACSYSYITTGGPGPWFCNTNNGTGDASVVIDNQTMPGYYESGIITIANPNVTGISMNVLSKKPSDAQVTITNVGTNQYKIILKGSTTSANIKVTYSNSCGPSVSNTVYVRTPNGTPLPVISIE